MSKRIVSLYLCILICFVSTTLYFSNKFSYSCIINVDVPDYFIYYREERVLDLNIALLESKETSYVANVYIGDIIKFNNIRENTFIGGVNLEKDYSLTNIIEVKIEVILQDGTRKVFSKEISLVSSEFIYSRDNKVF